jgi:hypothetical protein
VSDPRELSREELLAALPERDAVIAALLAEIEQLKRRVRWTRPISAGSGIALSLLSAVSATAAGCGMTLRPKLLR